MATQILCIAGPTASGKSARAVEEALARGGEAPHQPGWCGAEVISVDSRQVYRGLDVGTEKITPEEMRGIPHHLIDIREPDEPYSAGDFAADATRLIEEISARGKLPILVGGTHFYFDALLKGLPDAAPDEALRGKLEAFSTEELFARIRTADQHRAKELDPKNRRRLIRALELIEAHGTVPARRAAPTPYAVEWIIIDPPREELRARIDARLGSAFERGLVEEVQRVRGKVGDARLDELGLEYRVVGEFLRLPAGRQAANPEATLLPALSAKLWQYARRQKAWLAKLSREVIAATSSHPDRS